MSSTTPQTARPVVLSLQDVSKRFGAVQALRGVSVECLAGEIHAVVGENGSGKSTLLGIASGVLAPDEGTVEIGGRRPPPRPPAQAARPGGRGGHHTDSLTPPRPPAAEALLPPPPPR